MFAVRIARRCTDVCSTSGRIPAAVSSSPPRRASASPLAVRSTSTQPVKRFFAFHSLSPWRSRTSVLVMPSACQNASQCGSWPPSQADAREDAPAHQGVRRGIRYALPAPVRGLRLDVQLAGVEKVGAEQPPVLHVKHVQALLDVTGVEL